MNGHRKVAGNFIFCLRSGIVIGARDKYAATKQYAVEVVRGSKAKFHLEVTDEQDQPVSLAAETQREIIEACTVLTESDNSEEMAVLWANRPDQARLQEVWNKYDLWRYFVFVTNRPKPKKPKPKKPTEVSRIGATFAGAVRTALVEIKTNGNDGKEVITQGAMPPDVKRLLLLLSTRIPPSAYNTGQDLFGAWQRLSIKRETLRAMARDMYGKSGPGQLSALRNAVFKAATVSVASVRFVEVLNKGDTPKRGEVTVTPGSFIREIKWPTHEEEGKQVLDSDPDKVEITLNNVFGYWLNRFYGTADIRAIIDRSRGKGGAEYMAIRLWGIDIAPQVATATKTGPFVATIDLKELPTWQESGPENRRNIRERAIAIAPEAAKDMGAEYGGLVTRVVNGGESIIGLSFRWEKSVQQIEGKKAQEAEAAK